MADGLYKVVMRTSHSSYYVEREMLSSGGWWLLLRAPFIQRLRQAKRPKRWGYHLLNFG
jgi:hypothetical protein